MSRDSLIDYLSCLLIKSAGPLVRMLPQGAAGLLAIAIARLFYCTDLKRRGIVYANLKTAFAGELSPSALGRLTRKFYQNFVQNILDIFFIPGVDKAYIEKYVTIAGLENIHQALGEQKRIIFLSVHAGSWELANAVSSYLGFYLTVFVRDQRYPRLNRLLNALRRQKGSRLLAREAENKSGRKAVIKELIRALRNRQPIAMTLDQGGRGGERVKFFGKEASMASGAIRLALAYNATILPFFCIRIKGPFIKIIIDPPFEIRKTGERGKDIQDNLQRMAGRFQELIRQYPAEYLWSYKIWKYGRERNILILNDGKTGHYRQSQALAEIICGYLKNKGIKGNILARDIHFKNWFSRPCLALSHSLSGRYVCQGCLWCLKAFLKEDSYRGLTAAKPDIVISCGSAIAGINFVLARDNLAKSLVIMRPSLLSTRKFDLVIMPRHDRPPKRKNVVITEGVLNLINDNYIRSSALRLRARLNLRAGLVLGLLVGGDSRSFHLSRDLMREVIAQTKKIAEEQNAEVLITSSRRTPKETEKLLKDEFGQYGPARLLIIANESSPDDAVAGILGLSNVVIVSPESISMVSEAASAGRCTVVFKAEVGRRHSLFLARLAEKKYIYLALPSGLSAAVAELYAAGPVINTLDDRQSVEKAVAGII